MQKGRRRKRQLHNRPNIALRLAAVLLVMVCISTWMMDGLFAKYRTSDSGGDNARVIGFGNLTLTEEGDFGTAGGQGYFAPGMNLKKQAIVNFTGSESATYVFMEVTLSEHWKTEDGGQTFFIHDENATEKQLEWEVAGDWLTEDKEGQKFLTMNTNTITNDKGTSIHLNTYVYYRELAPNETLKAAHFIKDGKVEVSESIKRADIANIKKYIIDGKEYENDILINLRASVVQSNGFSGPKQAWDSISGKSSN